MNYFTCLICKDDIKENQFIQLDCIHTYCNECFIAWYSKDIVIPKCCYCFTLIDLEKYGIKKQLSKDKYILLMQNLLENQPIDHELFMEYYNQYNKNIHEYNFLIYVAFIGNLEIIKYLHEIAKIKIINNTINVASSRGHLHIVKYLHEIVGLKCSRKAIKQASYNGHFEVVKYLCEVGGLKCTKYILNQAICNGYLDIIKYIYEVVGINFSENIMELACYYNHLDVIKYLYHIVQLNFTDEAIKLVTMYSDPEIYEYLFKIRIINIMCSNTT